jgi:hypothetical protein
MPTNLCVGTKDNIRLWRKRRVKEKSVEEKKKFLLSLPFSFSLSLSLSLSLSPYLSLSLSLFLYLFLYLVEGLSLGNALLFPSPLHRQTRQHDGLRRPHSRRACGVCERERERESHQKQHQQLRKNGVRAKRERGERGRERERERGREVRVIASMCERCECVPTEFWFSTNGEFHRLARKLTHLCPISADCEYSSMSMMFFAIPCTIISSSGRGWKIGGW